jgi:membrane complex biogenesis BtpA family protein
MSQPLNFTSADCMLIGMVHLEALPGSPSWRGSMDQVIDRARQDAELLVQGGCHGILVENMGDVPYLKGRVYPETVAAMSVAAGAVTDLGLPTGIQVLAAANREALGIALACGASFIRVEGFAYAHVADEGWIDASAGELLRTRHNLGSEIAVWADIQKKHSAHAVTADLDLGEWVHGAAFCGADTVIITGSRTGRPPEPADVAGAVGQGCRVAVGSGVTADNVADYAQHADALIVGSALKYHGHWRNAVELSRVSAIRDALDSAK